MAKTQFPIDGKLGKQFKITSDFGWRIHPVTKEKRHHNGVDLWSTNETTYIEAIHDGKVIYAGPSKTKKSDGEPGGFGYYVVVQHKIDGKFYTSCYAHMKKGSIKVKVGQKIEAGTVLGIMGTTGMSTGRHLHLEVWVGKTHGWTNNGKGFMDPTKFIKALIAKEAAIAAAPEATPDTDPVAEAPTHDEAQAAAIEAARTASKARIAEQDEKISAPVTAPVAPVAAAPVATAVSYPDALSKEMALDVKNRYVIYVQQKLKLEATGEYNPETVKAVVALQKKHGFVADGVFGKLTWGKIIDLP
jgi:biotin carboxyl carrier protein